MTSIKLSEKLAMFSSHWDPHVVADYNQNEVMVVKFQGEYPFHKHDETDDFFYVLEGEMTMDIEGKPSHVVKAGELFIVPKGVVHRPRAIRSKPELFALAALVLKKKNSNNNHSLSFPHCGWRLNQAARNIQYFTLDGKNKKVEILKITSSYATVSVDDKPPFKVYLTAGLKLRGGDLSIDSLYDPIPALIYYGEWEIFIREDYIYFLRNGAYAKVERYNPEANAETATGGNTLTAPMPGKIIAANVKPGDAVKSGDKLIIMEAMKVEMSLEAPRDGVVAAVNCAADALVADGDVLLELETERKE